MNKADKFKVPQIPEDNTYPKYEAGKWGIRVRVSKGMYLPGEFSGQLQAERAYMRYLGRQAEVSKKRKQAKVDNNE